MSKNEYEETVRELYPTFSQVEIAEATHTSKSTVRRVVTELHLPVFLFGYQLFYYIEVVYVHIQFVTIVQR